MMTSELHISPTVSPDGAHESMAHGSSLEWPRNLWHYMDDKTLLYFPLWWRAQEERNSQLKLLQLKFLTLMPTVMIRARKFQ